MLFKVTAGGEEMRQLCPCSPPEEEGQVGSATTTQSHSPRCC